MNIDQVLKENLTDVQYDAAIDRAHEVLCLACAGSGKTRTLAYRITRLISEGELPESIVAFTFTEKAADSIKRRVSQSLVAAGLDPIVTGAMYIGTIHGFCQKVLGNVDAKYRQYDVLDDNRLTLYLMSRYPQLRLVTFRKRSAKRRYFDTIKQVAHAWKTANDELLDFAEIGLEDQELGDLLSRIRQRLDGDQYIDFSLMIRKIVEMIQNNHQGVTEAIGSLRHLMVDEYQDVNPCQEELVRLLRDRVDSLFVVGDDDQAIYAWRGADVSNIIKFDKRYPNCSVHTLSVNFRSTKPIVDATNSFIQEFLGPSRTDKSPTAHKNRIPQDSRVLWFCNRSEEAEWVASRISVLLQTAYDDSDDVRGLTPADFAVLMRSTRQRENDETPRHMAFTEALKNLEIPYTLEAGGGPFDRPQTDVLRSTFELLRTRPLLRSRLQEHFQTRVEPAYPRADFDALARVLTHWSNQIHRPEGTTRIRLYPQRLMYDLLEAFNVAEEDFDDTVMRDIGLFSRMILDIESVYMSVDSRQRFSDVLNFLKNPADTGYDVSTDNILQRPDAVTVSTVHKMKGLEFPCVFIVDVEAMRFPKRRERYRGWLPNGVMKKVIARGAYLSTPIEEARLFYTASTRAERYLYVSGAKNLPAGRMSRKPSPFSRQLQRHPEISDDPTGMPSELQSESPRRRLEDSDYPTSFTEIKSYLQCPKSYQFRERYGFNPDVPEMFGYGRTVHTIVQKLHEINPDAPPSPGQVDQVVMDTFHLKHVPQSRDPSARPGAYENAREQARTIIQDYVANFDGDFARGRQVEAVFEIPASRCLISGSIDLLLFEDDQGKILGAEIIDFKTLESGLEPALNNRLDWTELALQVQLYARAANTVLGQQAKTGNVHFLKDNRRVEIPISAAAIDAALENIEWAVKGILHSDFPMRPHPDKCGGCDFRSICPRKPEKFSDSTAKPPELHLPGDRERVRVQAFSQFK